MEKKNKIKFSVDAGIVNRLGFELVGRVETAVSELVKNAYDADANNVSINFIQTDETGGVLEITDDGHGMNQDELTNGFMRLSSPDKIDNPVSPKYKRVRAGKKGIGRFATHRLGKNLEIITKKKEEDQAIKVTINWDDYETHKELSAVNNLFEYVSADFEHGTKLIISHLREAWTTAQIKRVFRYVSELLQPDFLSDRSKGTKVKGETLKIASRKDGTFKVECKKTDNDGHEEVILNEDEMLFNKAVAVVEGYIDEDKDGYISVLSERFGIDPNELILVGSEKNANQPYKKWDKAYNIYFKAYYFIYNRPSYYISMTKMELKRIEELSRSLGSIWLYRNGFRVLPYGEPHNDWLRLDYRNRGRSGVNAPLGNLNIFGFVEIIDDEEFNIFEETSSREGLIENDALREVQDFVYKGLAKTRDLVSNKLLTEKEASRKGKRNQEFKDQSTKDLLNQISTAIGDSNYQQDKKQNYQRIVEQIGEDIQAKLDEIEMLRVWAGLGLAIGEFTHDVRQFVGAMQGNINALSQQEIDEEGFNTLERVDVLTRALNAYLSFFDEGTAKIESRDIAPIRLEQLIDRFCETVKHSKIPIAPPKYHQYGLYTTPMHTSELYAILFNLHSNSTKAIERAGTKGKIEIICGKEKSYIYIEFLDNGDGIDESDHDKIFEVFYSKKSGIASAESSKADELSGRGLGLKIVKDILEAHNGRIFVTQSPHADFNTCFRIEIPEAKEELD